MYKRLVIMNHEKEVNMPEELPESIKDLCVNSATLQILLKKLTIILEYEGTISEATIWKLIKGLETYIEQEIK